MVTVNCRTLILLLVALACPSTAKAQATPERAVQMYEATMTVIYVKINDMDAINYIMRGCEIRGDVGICEASVDAYSNIGWVRNRFKVVGIWRNGVLTLSTAADRWTHVTKQDVYDIGWGNHAIKRRG